MAVYIGIDIGSVSVDIVVASSEGNILSASYIRHNGRIDETILSALAELEGKHDIIAAAVTGIGAQRALNMLDGVAVNEVIALVKGVALRSPHARSIIDIGGQDSKLIFLEQNLKNRRLMLKDFSMNSFCAAGTGSFLDQQAARLKLTIQEFAQRAVMSHNPARVAGRCSVFAKSDMIHLQQKGTPEEDIVSGLCMAVANNFKANIAKGKDLCPPVAFTGGVSMNPGVLKAFRNVFEMDEEQMYVPEYATVLCAYGAVGWLLDNPGKAVAYKGIRSPDREGGNEAFKEKLPALKAKTECGVSCCDDRGVRTGEAVFLGIDIGSISTNIVVIDSEAKVVFKRYLMTAGRPVEAVREGLRQLGAAYGNGLSIAGAATTGSARFLIGDLIGADIIKNEITAHAEAAVFMDPEVDTVFEIGGQDSKYIHICGGMVDDFTMNKACAAGTGSFLEEQAQKLDVKIKDEFSRLALSSSRPLDCGEKCTVFMESEVVKYFQQGQKISDITAGLAYSIVNNYLYKVVENRPIGRRIFFQGGVATNKAVVAAFEQVTGKTVNVPVHHEVMGALGCCLLAHRSYAGNAEFKSRFKGIDCLERPLKADTFECPSCDNHCEINRISEEGSRTLYYGGRCEKYEVSLAQSKSSIPDYFNEREGLLGAESGAGGEKPVVGIPRIQMFYEYFPFFKAFFEEMGFSVSASPQSNRGIIKRGIDSVRTSSCFPTKLAHGHVSWIADKAESGQVDFAFIPSVREACSCSPEHHPMANHCDFTIFMPEMASQSLHMDERRIKILKPELHFRLGKQSVKQELYKMMRSIGNYSLNHVRRACEAAFDAYYGFRDTMLKRGREALAAIPPDDKAVVLIGKLHNTCDKALTLDLPKIWRGLGVHCFPMDFFDLSGTEEVHSSWYNTTLAMGQRMMSLTDIIRKIPNVYPVFVTNFSCVNDSMMSHFIKSELGGKPALYLEIDEHSGEAGIITRCEAFLDAIKSRANTHKYLPERVQRRPFVKDQIKTLYIPYVARGSRIWAYAFRHCGINAVSLPEPDLESLECGKRFTTGEECYPCILMTGDIFKKIMASPEEKGMAFFSPGSCGSCRYDSFNPLHNVALKKLMKQKPDMESVVIVDDYAKANPQFKKIISSPKYMFTSVKAFFALDILNRMLMNIRPYECEKGMTERVFEECIDSVGYSLEMGKGFSDALGRASSAMLSIPVDRTVKRPRIGVMGEAYIRNVDFSSNDMIRTLEMLGAEVVTPPAHELIKYTLYKNIYYSEKAGKHFNAALARLKNRIIDSLETKYVKPVINYLGYDFDPCMLNHVRKSGITLKAGTHMGSAIEMINYRADGIINAIPFNCVPGMVVESLMERFTREYPNIPFMTLICQGQNQANNLTRLETLVHQCREKIREEKMDERIYA
ncbi:putative CoA-substrate-specific enzyme activase [Anaerobacterium chartisolvens]|uniref:Putative CoA-substrate-specific enzyme activase n=1 Tax=Anaerobacterium chartisolvens TaxID=1297424 RepID=A0A369BBD3_9FIRM|nr:acyl-CoA dehydratase activase [Anaerobacterium chartisolvens]RCX18842.1 putative CoA-substrate-specific enzyme activase [Anaerobacterium chartisolvens]